MRRRARCRLIPLVVALVATAALGACRQYEPIQVWDPNRPAPAVGESATRPSPPPAETVGRAPRTTVERAPLEAAVRPPSPPPRAVAAPPPPSAPPPSPPLSSSSPPSPPPAPTSAPARTTAGSVTVQGGETLFAISRRTGVPVRALIDANDLKPPYGLQTGRRLTVPANRFHEVQAGETLYSVSRRYGVAMSELVRENRMGAPFVVRSGERLKIPASTAPSEPMVASAPPPSSPPTLQVPTLQVPTLQVPAGAPSAPPTVAAMPPSLPSRPGVLGTLPGAEPPTLPPERPAPPVAMAPSPVAPSPIMPPPMVTPPPMAAPHPAPGAPPVMPPPPPQAPSPPPLAVRPPAAAEPPPREGRGFAWPVRGPVLTRFGPTGRGLHNDGINISAAKGATVVASDAGVVAYAGNELRGFGNLLLIKHADGWVSAYAHNDTLLVKRGDRVRRGQPIARVGQSGNVGEPQLHFELRRGTRAVDPAEYLDTQASGVVPVRPYPGASTAALRDPG